MEAIPAYEMVEECFQNWKRALQLEQLGPSFLWMRQGLFGGFEGCGMGQTLLLAWVSAVPYKCY